MGLNHEVYKNVCRFPFSDKPIAAVELTKNERVIDKP